MSRALALVLLAACGTPSQEDPARYGTVTVAFGDSLDGVWSWRSDQLPHLRATLATLSALGPRFVEAPEGSADVVVRAASLDGACGKFSTGLRFVEVDATCGGYDSLRAATAHELAHWLTWTRWHWVGHICDHPSDGPDCHPTVTGPALLSPGLVPVDPGATFDEAWSGSTADERPREADLALVRLLAGGAP